MGGWFVFVFLIDEIGKGGLGGRGCWKWMKMLSEG